MSRPFITALIDTYNQESLIADAIQSVVGQDFPASETEILVVDDGSTDNTPDIVQKFRPRVRYVRKGNGGQASAFNVGIREAQGEIVAFLDGDDWWAPGKLTAVASVFEAESGVGLVGHGITSVYPDQRQVVELSREIFRFRMNSVDGAKALRMCRGFLGTSRMAYRRQVLQEIGEVPEALKFEADEYLFTLAGLFADVMILNKSHTFYRLHENNLYQVTNGSSDAIRRKQEVVAALAQSLGEKLAELGVPSEIARTLLECVQVEADHLRLVIDGGFPWETVSTEIRIMRLFYADASLWQHMFSCARLFPALVMPADTYYRWRQRFARASVYRRLRREFLPFPTPAHVYRKEEQTK
jgi:cellulose synthase/poly-beta-1,6-N-acetylglucosamine synthase-like glycosyltransferase